jgi:hypothetical protein
LNRERNRGVMEEVKDQEGKILYKAQNGFTFESPEGCKLFEDTGVFILGDNGEREVRKWVLKNIRDEELEELGRELMVDISSNSSIDFEGQRKRFVGIIGNYIRSKF